MQSVLINRPLQYLSVSKDINLMVVHVFQEVARKKQQQGHSHYLLETTRICRGNGLSN